MNSTSAKARPAYWGAKQPSDQILIVALVGLLFVALGLVLYRLVDAYQVNIIFWDELDNLTPIFMRQDAWTMFAWQHGPVRMGLGELVTWVVIQLTRWNTRAESFTMLGIFILSGALALLLKRILIGRFQPIDLILPFIVLDKYQYELMIRVPMIAHSALPLLLIFLYALAWLIPSPPWRIGAVSILNFLLVFTGFGLLMGPMTIAVFALELLQGVRGHSPERTIQSAIGLFCAGASAIAFADGWHFWTGTTCFGEWANLPSYPQFLAVMAAKFAGVDFAVTPTAAVLVGALLLAGLIGAFGWHVRGYVRDPFNPSGTSKVIAILTGFTLLFAASAAFGRVCGGMDAAQVSRYVTLWIPGFVGCLIAISAMRTPRAATILGLALALLLVKTILPFDQPDEATIVALAEGKAKWKQCYLQTGDYLGCNQSTGFSIYPEGPDRWASMHPELAAYGTGPVRIISRLDFLKAQHLNLYEGTQ